MAKLDIDKLVEDKFEPIELTIDGCDYALKTIPAELIDEFTNVSSKPATLRVTLAKILNVPDDAFKKTDVRKLVLASRHIITEAEKQITEFRSKNVQGEGVEKTR